MMMPYVIALGVVGCLSCILLISYRWFPLHCSLRCSAVILIVSLGILTSIQFIDGNSPAPMQVDVDLHSMDMDHWGRHMLKCNKR